MTEHARDTDGSLRVVHLIPHLTGSAGRYVIDVAMEQQRRESGRVAIVVSADAEGTWASAPALLQACRAAGVPVYTCGDFFHRQVEALHWAAQAVRRDVLGGRPWGDGVVVHAHTALAAVVGRKAGAPRVVLTVHGTARRRPPEFDLQDDLALMACDEVLVPSARLARHLREQRDLERVSVVRPALRVPPAPEVQSASTKAPLVRVGALTVDEDADVVATALDLLNAEMTDVRLEGARGEGAVAIAGVFVSLELLDHPAPDALEAMAQGVPVVAVEGGALAELVAEARCGVVIPTRSARDVALGVQAILSCDAETRRALGASGHQFARARLDMEPHVDALSRAYWPGTRRLVSWRPPAGPVRLHLGSGADRREGWVNVDARPDSLPDIVARVHDLWMVPDEGVDVIEACHLFEHLSWHDARRALREWYRVLRPGGRLLLELPNLDACVGLLAGGADELGHALAMGGIYGWPEDVEVNGDAMAHRWGWTPDSLGVELAAAGFVAIEVLPVTQTYRPAARYGRDFRIGATRPATGSTDA